MKHKMKEDYNRKWRECNNHSGSGHGLLICSVPKLSWETENKWKSHDTDYLKA